MEVWVEVEDTDQDSWRGLWRLFSVHVSSQSPFALFWSCWTADSYPKTTQRHWALFSVWKLHWCWPVTLWSCDRHKVTMFDLCWLIRSSLALFLRALLNHSFVWNTSKVDSLLAHIFVSLSHPADLYLSSPWQIPSAILLLVATKRYWIDHPILKRASDSLWWRQKIDYSCFGNVLSLRILTIILIRFCISTCRPPSFVSPNSSYLSLQIMIHPFATYVSRWVTRIDLAIMLILIATTDFLTLPLLILRANSEVQKVHSLPTSGGVVEHMWRLVSYIVTTPGYTVSLCTPYIVTHKRMFFCSGALEVHTRSTPPLLILTASAIKFIDSYSFTVIVVYVVYVLDTNTSRY